jgi:hypothetical protein
MFQQYCNKELVLVVTSIISMAQSVKFNDFEQNS